MNKIKMSDLTPDERRFMLAYRMANQEEKRVIELMLFDGHELEEAQRLARLEVETLESEGQQH